MQPTGAAKGGDDSWFFHYVPMKVVVEVANAVFKRMGTLVPPMRHYEIDDTAAYSMMFMFAVLYISSKEQRRLS